MTALQQFALVPVDEFQAKATHLLRDYEGPTRENYLRRLPDFHSFARDNGFDKRVIRNYNRYLLERTDIAASTKDAYLVAARALMRELRFEYDLPEVSDKVKWAGDKGHKKFGHKDDEVETLVEYLRTLEPTPENLRLKAVMSLLLFQGLRQIEITRLTVEDVNFNDLVFMVQGKGRHDKETRHMHPITASNLQAYLEASEIKSGPIVALSTRDIRRQVTRLFKDLNISRSTHGTRHWFTTKLIKLFEGNLLEVMKYTGHRNIQTLVVYYDEVKTDESLPKYYEAFKEYNF